MEIEEIRAPDTGPAYEDSPPAVTRLDAVNVDKVVLAAHRGFCAGVEKAIKALDWMTRVFEPPVFCYHEIVHNQFVVDYFKSLGVVFIDDVTLVPAGAPVMRVPTARRPRSSRPRGPPAVRSSTPSVLW